MLSVPGRDQADVSIPLGLLLAVNYSKHAGGAKEGTETTVITPGWS